MDTVPTHDTMTDYVTAALDGHADEFDVAAIVDDLAALGPVDLATALDDHDGTRLDPTRRFWKIVEQHDRRSDIPATDVGFW